MILLKIVFGLAFNLFLYGTVLHYTSVKIKSPISYPKSIYAWAVIQMSSWVTNFVIQRFTGELSNLANNKLGALLCGVYCFLFLPLILEGPSKYRLKQALALGAAMSVFAYLWFHLFSLGYTIYRNI